MKKLLLILLLSPGWVFGQRYQVSPAEYTCGIVDHVSGKMWYISGDTLTVANTPSCVWQVASGAHGQMVIGCDSMVSYQGDNMSGEAGIGNTSPISGFVKITVDSIGNPFKNIIQVVCAGTTGTNPYYSLALKSDGTVWVWGITQYGIAGNNTGGALTTTRPIQVPFPAGTFITKVQGGLFIQAIDSAGKEWRWGSNLGFFAHLLLGQGTGSPVLNIPVKVTFPGATGRVIDIAEGDSWGFSLFDDHNLYASTYYGIYSMTGSGPASNGPGENTLPFRVDTAITLSAPIRHIYANNNGTFFVCTDSTAWFAGDNCNGNAGDGTELNYAIYTISPAPTGGTPAPYAWDQNAGTCQLPYRKPHQIVPGKHDWVAIWVTSSLNYCAWGTDAHDNLYAWGRGKGGMLGDQLLAKGSNIDGTYPNSYDRPYVTKVNPFSNVQIPVTSPYCILNPSGTPCNTYSIPANTKPTASLTASIISGNAIVLNGSGSTDNAYINYYVHTQTSGTALQMGVQSGPKDTIYGVANGTYAFKLKVTDNGWLSDSTTGMVIVGGLPTVNAGTDQAITLPTASKALTGTATAAAGNGALTYLWTKTSGPGTTTITGNTTLTPTMSGLQAGVYIFQLQATDTNSNTQTDQVQVTVNAAIVTGGHLILNLPYRFAH